MREDGNWRKGATRCSNDGSRGRRKALLLGVERMLRRAIFDRERAYVALK